MTAITAVKPRLSTAVKNAQVIRPLTVSHQRSVPQIVPPELRISDSALAVVFRSARLHGPITRDNVSLTTGLSIATVNRQIIALLGSGLLRERSDLTTSGAMGRPRVPVEVNAEPFFTLGIHIGARATSFVAVDLLGRALDAVKIRTPAENQSIALESLAQSAGRYLARWRKKRPLWVGVAIGGNIDTTKGLVDHGRLSWVQAPLGSVLSRALNLPISLSAHVEAMAASELILPPQGRDRDLYPRRRAGSSSLYVYARETVGSALIIDGRVHSPLSGPGTISHLPVESKLLGGGSGVVGLEDAVSDQAIVFAAQKLGLFRGTAETGIAEVYNAAQQGSELAQQLLAERARVLGKAVALIRDIVNPDEVVVAGQAFTGYASAFSHVVESFTQSSVRNRSDIRISRFGNRVQEVAAGVVSLGSIYSDPLAAVGRTLQ